MLMLTGCRLSEVQEFRREHVDLAAGELLLPDPKTDVRMVHLCDLVFVLLSRINRNEGNTWIIPGRNLESLLADLQYPWRSIRVRFGLDDVCSHDLRRVQGSCPCKSWRWCLLTIAISSTVRPYNS